MGYFTVYNLTATPLDEDRPADPARVQALEKEVEKMNVFDDGAYDVGWSGYVKWYDYESDMGLLSRRFPDFLFYLEGDGEGYGDFWGDFYVNGKVMREATHIIRDPFNPAKAVSANGIINNPFIDGPKEGRYTYQNGEE